MILNPRTVWPFWPGCAILVSVLLLVPERIWPILIPAAFAAFAVYDLQIGSAHPVDCLVCSGQHG